MSTQISDAEWEDMLEGFDERSYLNARRWRPGDDPYTLYAFNQRESERIPSNRALRDTRHYRYTHTHTHERDTYHTHTPPSRLESGTNTPKHTGRSPAVSQVCQQSDGVAAAGN